MGCTCTFLGLSGRSTAKALSFFFVYKDKYFLFGFGAASKIQNTNDIN
ncbi:MAG TPA: hypothetical protein VN703_00110 [Candidatus Sulfopaludibacter sp.]|nr:hypothetical protein [Candidatus Sulfopaludibacter sp.]